MPRIRISSAINGFRRAGVAHPSQPTVHPAGRFSEEQIKQLKAEPRLAVEFLPDEPEPEAPAGPAADSEGAVESDGVLDDLIDAHLDGVVEPDGTQKSLEEMDEEEVRQIGKKMGIKSYHNLGLEKLIEKIKTETVQIDPKAEV